MRKEIDVNRTKTSGSDGLEVEAIVLRPRRRSPGGISRWYGVEFSGE